MTDDMPPIPSTLRRKKPAIAKASKVIEYSTTGKHTVRSGTYVDPEALADLAERIDVEHREAETAARTALESALECGDLLLQAKALVTHGEWLPWLEKNTSVSRRMSQRYMVLAKSRPALEANATRVSLLSVREALAAISNQHQRLARLPAPVVAEVVEKTPDDARLKKALSQAEATQRLNQRQQREASETPKAATDSVKPVGSAATVEFWDTLTEEEKDFVDILGGAIIAFLAFQPGTSAARILDLFNEAGCHAMGERWEA